MHNYINVYVKCIGQFLNADVNMDTENMLMKLSDRNPILVKRDKVWPFLGIDVDMELIPIIKK